MANLEGPLSKWTNVVNGWQYRWFVLDQSAGLLSYYTSKENMMRGSRRGCIRLNSAIVGIDDEDDSTFTITVQHKTFHFQARDGEERERWISGLEDAILRHSQPFKAFENTNIDRGNFERKISEADAYLDILIQQVKNLSVRIEQCADESAQQKFIEIKMSAEELIEGIKQTIMHLQICKQNIESPLLNGSTIDPGMVMASQQQANQDRKDSDIGSESYVDTEENLPGASKSQENSAAYTSYSSSDDDDFFDAEDDGKASPVKGVGEDDHRGRGMTVIKSEDDCYDDLYDDEGEDELESLDQHGSIITHLLSQVRIGMDLTKIVLPTFILERRSLLEMFADFLAHPDLFVQITDSTTPRDRMVECVRWYLSAFHAGRKSEVAKKPYNPILGETFRCYYDLPTEPKTTELASEGPVPWASKNNVAMLAEQVSHHPPISAFYAEHHNRRISVNGYVWTKSKFLGLSIGVHMIGQTVVSVLDHEEDYIMTFPSGYGRSILTVPWVELGGKTTISCPKTGYYANIDFLTKPFYGGKKNLVTAEIYSPDDRKSFCSISGEWNGAMWARYSSGQNELFIDIKAMPIFKKQVRPREEQEEFESRRLWSDVTTYLKAKNVELATAAKHTVEQRQRVEARERKERNEVWETKVFHEVGEHWIYDHPLIKQLRKAESEAALEDKEALENTVPGSDDDVSTEQSDFFDDAGEEMNSQ